MNTAKIFNDILDACLDSLAQGETPEQCLGRYPGQAAELEALLRTAAAARQATDVTPRAEARVEGWRQVSNALREPVPARVSIFAMPRWAVAVAALALFFVAGGAVVGAAYGKLPDNFLYPVKLTAERVQLAFTFSELEKTELLVSLANRRVSEITAMAEKGKPDKMAAPARRLDELLVAATGPMLTAPAMLESFSPPDNEISKGTAPSPTTPPVEPPKAGEETPSVTATAPQIMGVTSDNAAPLSPEQAGLIEMLRRYQVEDPQKLQAVLDIAPPQTKALLESIISRYPPAYQRLLDTWQTPLP